MEIENVLLIKNDIKNILDYAKNHGINLIDTASIYGKSEESLGKNNIKDLNHFKIT